jgi:DNA-binding GntR family transcriptional regulator
MKQSKKDRAFDLLKERILSLHLPPDSALDEVALSAKYGLSRTPMREVFQRLAGEGYVSLENNRGASVSSMDLETMRGFFQIAPMVYAAVARLATEQATPSQIEMLKKIQTQFARSVKAAAATDMAMHNHRFHEQMGVMAASPYLAPSLGRLLIDHTRMAQRFYRANRSSSGKRVALACEQHEAMIEAICNRQSALTVDLTLAHWELSRGEMNKYVLPDPLPIDQSQLDINSVTTAGIQS